MSFEAIQPSTAGPSRQRSSYTPADSTSCISCGKCWPWVIFQPRPTKSIHTINVCNRCVRPDLEAQRWKQIGEQMRNDLIKARQKVAKRQKELGYSDTVAKDHGPQSLSQPPLHTSSESRPRQLPTVKTSKCRQRYLTEEQLAIVASSLPTLKTISEPQRATLWLQMTFRPSTPDKEVRQVELFNSYRLFFQDSDDKNGNSSSSLIEGANLIKLAIKLWQEVGVKMEGRPRYTISGLEYKTNSMTDGKSPLAGPSQLNVSQSQPNTYEHHFQPNPTQALVDPPSRQVVPQSILLPVAPLHKTQSTFLLNEPSVQIHKDRPETVKEGHLDIKRIAKRSRDGSIPKTHGDERKDGSSMVTNHQVIVIDDDDEEEEDDWSALKQKKRAKTGHPGPILSIDQKVTADLSIQPRPRASSGIKNYSTTSSHRQHQEEEDFDELDDDDVVMIPTLEEGVVHELRGSADEEAEVGDMLF
ncbi:uncharacterized protein IL334_006916 [Kwoniella shivajii]|uniref:Uncharacterized protein n=1 Tax=Kwoniella shivajii TaxID=564305 RepID=A0ABZ1D7A1_9TREE|nr:hypothetical protein IL334_006916 [Kwoniella shivajii]